MGQDGARGPPAARGAWPRHRSRRADRRSADRVAADGGAGARIVLGRAHYHPRRADLGVVAPRGRAIVRRAKKVARRRPLNRLHLAFPRRHPARLRHDHGIPQRPQGRDHARRRDQQDCADRAHDRSGPSGVGRQLPQRHQAQQPPSGADDTRNRGPVARPSLPRRLAPGAGRRGAGHLWLHGMRPSRAGANLIRQAQARSRRVAVGGRQDPLREHGGGAPRRHRLRSRESALDAVSRGANL